MIGGGNVWAAFHYTAHTFRINTKDETRKLNQILAEIQGRGGEILDIKLSLYNGYVAYLILYRAERPLWP